MAAFWQTVWFLTLHPVQFVAEAARPGGGDFVGARSFRSACVWCATASCLAPVLAEIVSMPGTRPSFIVWSLAPLGGLGFAVWYFFTMLTDVALVDVTYFLGDRDLEWEVVLSDYSAGLLGWAPVPGILAAASAVLLNTRHRAAGGFFLDASLFSLALLGLMLVVGPVFLFRAASRRGLAACVMSIVSVVFRLFSAALTAMFVFGLSLIVTIPLALLTALLWQQFFG